MMPGGGGHPPYGQMPQQMYVPAGNAAMVYPVQQFPQQQPMYPGQMNPAGMPPGGQRFMPPGGQRMMAPPAYRPDMTKEYLAKQAKLQRQQQQLMEQQRRQMEQAVKQHQFKEQQKRLKEFSAIGGRKMDADSLIESIIGPKTQQRQQQQQHHQQARLGPQTASNHAGGGPPIPDADDGFGDFLSGPAMPASQPDQSQSIPGVPPTNSVRAPVAKEEVVAKPPEPDPKKDLVSMMFECSDLKAPQKARGFVKPSVKEIKPQQARASSFQQSQKARKWEGASDNQLSQLFTLPAPEFQMPKWITGESPAPEVYNMVLEAVSKEDKIQTELVYPILLRSSLPKETLGHIWSMCNKANPGQLTKEELFLILAMISVAQNNLNFTTLDILSRCPQAPIPNLGQANQHPQQPAALSGEHPAGAAVPGQPVSAPLLNNAAVPPGVVTPLASGPLPMVPGGVGSGPSTADEDDDFADFQAARAQAPNASVSLPGAAAPHVINTLPTSSLAVTAPVCIPALPSEGATAQNTDLMADDPYAALRVVDVGNAAKADAVVATGPGPSQPGPAAADDDFADFAAFDGPSAAGATPLDIQADLRTKHVFEPAASGSGLGSAFGTPCVSGSAGGLFHSDSSSLSGTPSAESSASASSSASAASRIFGWTGSSSSSSNASGGCYAISESSASNAEDFSDFASADPPAPSETAFGDFKDTARKEPSSGVQGQGQIDRVAASLGAGGNDRYAALKAMIADPNLFKEPAKPAKDLEKDDGHVAATSGPDKSLERDSDNTGWGDFRDNSMDSLSSATTDTHWSSTAAPLDGAPNAAPPATGYDLFQAVTGLAGSMNTSASAPVIATGSAADQPGNDWANFESAPPGETRHDSAAGKAQFHIGSDNETATTVNGAGGANQRLRADKVKANSMFARNLAPLITPPSGIGISPLDTMPPELPPELDETPDDDDFDKFGTFHTPSLGSRIPGVSSSDGISSLAGGIDDFGDFTSPGSIVPPPFGGGGGGGGGGLATQGGLLSNGRGGAFAHSRNASRDMTDSISTSSMEFTGWTGKSDSKASPSKEDSQSQNSLDFRIITAKGSKDGSPSGGDSQSVSSLELDVNNKKLGVLQDQKSVSSLELKGGVETSGEATSGSLGFAGGMEESFGDFTTGPQRPSLNSEYIQNPRDVKEIMAKGDFPNLGDRYTGFSQEPQDNDRHLYDWERCLRRCKELIDQALTSLSATSSSAVLKEVVASDKGATYLKGIVEVYRVVRRIQQAMKGNSLSNDKLAALMNDIENSWAALTVFIATTSVMPDRASLDYSKSVLKSDVENAVFRACGVCILSVDCKRRPLNEDNTHKLTYSGRQYHASCANFWINCVDNTLPALKIPELL